MVLYVLGDDMKERINLPLYYKNFPFFYHPEDLKRSMEEIRQFLEHVPFLNNHDFTNRVLFSQEVKSNNTIEGYLDDIRLIKDIIKHPSNVLKKEEKQRILNLYHGYCYINTHDTVNKDSLKDLYQILSKGLLSLEDRQNMGEYYREKPVYIFYSDRMDVEPDQGFEAFEIEAAMARYFAFFKNDMANYDSVDHFIHSQILHFYFCVVHPYFDINGRTSRTMSMWYLLLHEAYPFIIFNRAIQLNKSYYYKVIRESKKYVNVSCFLKYMLENGLIELEKEAAMQEIASSTSLHLTAADYQAMYYVLSMKGNWTLADFASFYNRLNDKKSFKEIYDTMLDSLFQKGILLPKEKTKRYFNDMQNHFFSFAPGKLEQDITYPHLELKRKL